MNKNKGYYSWIHSLKNAAMQSQQKGFEMLKEAREMGGDEELKARLKARKMELGRDTNLDEPHNKKDVKPAGDANAVIQDAEDGVMGDEGLEYVSRIPTTQEPAIRAGTFPPPSGVHPPPQFPTPEAAAAEVSRLNASRKGNTEQTQTRAFHQQEATKAAKAAVEAARKAGKGPKGQKAAAVKAVEDYKNLRRKELAGEPPERYTEVEGGMLPMESVSHKIDRLLGEEKASRPGPITDPSIVGGFPRGMLGLIKGPKTEKAIMSLMVDMVDNPENYDPKHVRHAHETLQTISKFMNQTEED